MSALGEAVVSGLLGAIVCIGIFIIDALDRIAKAIKSLKEKE